MGDKCPPCRGARWKESTCAIRSASNGNGLKRVKWPIPLTYQFNLLILRLCLHFISCHFFPPRRGSGAGVVVTLPVKHSSLYVAGLPQVRSSDKQSPQRRDEDPLRGHQNLPVLERHGRVRPAQETALRVAERFLTWTNRPHLTARRSCYPHCHKCKSEKDSKKKKKKELHDLGGKKGDLDF